MPTLLDKGYFQDLGNDVLDIKTAKALEITSLADKVRQYCITHTGSVLTRQRIFNPSTDGEVIKARQDALKELRSDDKLKQSTIDFLERVRYKEGEEDVDREARVVGFLNDKTGFFSLSTTRNMLAQLSSWVNEMPIAESGYLRGLQDDIKNLKGSRAEELSQRPFYRQRGNVVAKSELKWYLPATRYRPYSHTIGGALAGGSLLGFGAYKLLAFAHDPSIGVFMASFVVPTMSLGFGLVIPEIVQEKFVVPIKDYFKSSTEVNNALAAIASLDELVAQDEFGKSLGEYSCLPEIINRDQHEIELKDLVNPLQYLKNPENYIPNNIQWGGGKQLVFFTGPNSGGKTSASTAAQHAQILFQSGNYVPAAGAKMTIADRIYNQVVEANEITEEEGGLGSQLRRSKEVLFGCSPRSFVVIDDLNEATTFEEKMQITSDILYGFIHKGPTTVYVSHLYQLAQEFEQKGLGDYIQVEFNKTRPTHRIIRGISTNSHANLVAKRIGIDDDSILHHLKENGYKCNNLREADSFKGAYGFK